MRLPTLKYTLRGLLLLALYILAGRMGVAIHSISGYSPLIWAPSGIALAALVLVDKNLWPWVFLAGTVMGLLAKYPPATAILIGCGNAFECWFGAYCLRRFAGPKPTFTQLREVLVFVILVMGLTGFLSATFDVAALNVTGVMPLSSFFQTWRTWWIGEATGNLVLGALLIAWWNDIRFHLDRVAKFKWEALALVLAISLTSLLVYTPLAEYNHSLLVRPYFLFSLMIWASIRFDVLGATSTSLILAVAVILGALKGFVAPSTVPIGEHMIVHQFMAVALGTMGLVLASAIREKEEAVEARNEFLSIASHELRTPITSLSLQLELFRRSLNDNVRASAPLPPADFVHGAGKQVRRLTQIVDQLLDVTRIGGNRLSLQYEEVDLSQLLKNLTDRLRGDLERADCRVSLNVQPLIVGQWDPFRVEQVFENILSNAIKYAAGRPVEITARREENQVLIEVRDQGPGIEAAKQEVIFDRFVRGRVSNDVQGLGLGLFITRQIVEAHGGEIWVTSRLGEGTRFHVKLPLAQPVVETKSSWSERGSPLHQHS